MRVQLKTIKGRHFLSLIAEFFSKKCQRTKFSVKVPFSIFSDVTNLIKERPFLRDVAPYREKKLFHDKYNFPAGAEITLI